MKILLLGLLLSLFSCKIEAKNTDNITDTIPTLQETIPLPDNKNKEKETSFPKNVEILLPVQYRKESTGYPKNVNKKDWHEIYKEEKTNIWKISKADLKISYGRDECVGEDVMIINSGHKDAVLFFTPFEGLSENMETILEDKLLIPGNSVNFKMNGNNYILSFSGKINNEEANPISKTDGFTLSFSSDKVKKYTIAVMSELSDDTPKIIWAGDLNDDDLPDMILDLSEDYESSHLFFFLSDKNDPIKPLKKIGDALVVFDC